MIHYDSFLQNATDIITKCDSYVITKCERSSLQNTPGFALQNATVLLQNATMFYYKMRRLVQIDQDKRRSKYGK